MGATIALTGSTGLLGRNILFEMLGKDPADIARIVVLGDRRSHASLRDRICQLMIDDGLDCMGLPISALTDVMARIECVDFELGEPGLGLSAAGRRALRERRIDALVHCAAATTFKTDDASRDKVMRINVDGLWRLLDLCRGLDLGKFVHISSAYSSGRMQGAVKPDDIDLDGAMPNPYQRSKAIGEMLVRAFGLQSSFETVILRPSTIGGRLLDGARGEVNKYDVYLGWAKALLRLKAHVLGGLDAALTQRASFPVRLAFHPGSGLNIVPADWCARCVVYAATHDTERDAYHLTNPALTPHATYLSMLLDAVGIDGFTFVPVRPAVLNAAESLYYHKIGNLFADYIEPAPLLFDTVGQSELT